MRQRASLSFQPTTKSLVFAKLHGAIVNVGKPPALLPVILHSQRHVPRKVTVVHHASRETDPACKT